MGYKRFNLFLIAVLFIVVFFTIPTYNNWVTHKLLGDNIDTQMHHLSLRDRKLGRWGYSYGVFMNIAANIPDPKNAILLLPPKEYLQKLNVTQFTTVEPAEFYYFTGLKSVWATSPHADSANWEVFVRADKQIMLRKIPSKGYLDTVLAIYRKFKES